MTQTETHISPAARRRIAILAALRQGMSCDEAAEACGCSFSAVRRVIQTYRSGRRSPWAALDAAHDISKK